LQPSARGEYEITEAIQGLIDLGLDVRSHIVSGWWKDTGTVEAMLEANRLILEDIQTSIDGDVCSDSKIEGRVIIGPGSVVKNSIIRGPAILGSNVVIENSFVGPFTAIDSGTILRNSEIEFSIVLGNSLIENCPDRLESCLIGRGARVERKESRPRTIQLVLGDSSTVGLP
jgi:glucose-1-phosphate thymidylyltransferase